LGGGSLERGGAHLSLAVTRCRMDRLGCCRAGLHFRKEKPMNADTIKGQWKQLKGNVKQRWGKLTDDDLDIAEGHRDKLAGKIQERYGYAREQAEKEVDEFFNSSLPR
jgi:uncharacterized protein YjbJ (UPF0337 family)